MYCTALFEVGMHIGELRGVARLYTREGPRAVEGGRLGSSLQRQPPPSAAS